VLRPHRARSQCDVVPGSLSALSPPLRRHFVLCLLGPELRMRSRLYAAKVKPRNTVTVIFTWPRTPGRIPGPGRRRHP